MSDKPKLPCGSCKYLGWQGLVHWCRHPAHVEPIRPRLAQAIAQQGGKCGDWIEWAEKIVPGRPFPWPKPVSLVERISG